MNEIVVGVDGSPASDDALRWAVHEASRRGASLVVVHGYDWRVYGAYDPIGTPYPVDAQRFAEAIVDSAVAEARSLRPEVAVRGETVLGTAGHGLIEASANADLVVVGHRGRGGFSSLLLGSVGQQVAIHAAASVVVVRGRADAASGPILVGVDDSAAADFALGVAFEEASLRKAGVLAMHVYAPPIWIYGPDIPLDPDEEAARREKERSRVAAMVARWRETFPDVDVAPVAIEGQPANALTDTSQTSQLVIVGTRGRGGFAGLLLGSVGLQLLHHAGCPVLIARPPAAHLATTA